MCHSHTVRLHGVALTIVIVAYLSVVKVTVREYESPSRLCQCFEQDRNDSDVNIGRTGVSDDEQQSKQNGTHWRIAPR